MNKKLILILVVLATAVAVSSCSLIGEASSDRDYKIVHLNIYKDTPAWKLALAVKKQDTRKIEKLIKADPDLINYQDPKYGATLLLWAVGTERYSSAKTLLKCGADPNIPSKRNGSTYAKTPLFLAAGYSWVDSSAKKDPKYVKLLLNYGADPNWSVTASENSFTEAGTTPLMNSILCGIGKTEALVEAGADINHKTESGRTAATIALTRGGPNATLGAMEYAYYLVAQRKAKVNEPYYRRKDAVISSYSLDHKFYPVDILRDWIPELGSKGYQMKMEIIDEFARQGVNYWETKIPKDRLEQIQKLYPNTWEEYIKKY